MHLKGAINKEKGQIKPKKMGTFGPVVLLPLKMGTLGVSGAIATKDGHWALMVPVVLLWCQWCYWEG